MSKTKNRIIETADELFYKNGFEHTSFAHIAEMLNISRGNFYHHFKTKDEILEAVINHRINKTNSMLETWEIEGNDPSERIRSFINILIMNRTKIKKYGCPVGSLCSELVKLNHDSLTKANQLFSLFRIWLKKQFESLGYVKDAENLAMHLLSRSQGIATLASAFNDDDFIEKEVKYLNEWLNTYTETNSNT